MSYQPPPLHDPSDEQTWQPQTPSHTSYPPQQPFPSQLEWQQPLYPQQTPPLPYQPSVSPELPPKKKRGTLFWLLVIGGILLIFVVGLTILNAAFHSSTTTSPDSTPVPTTISALDKDGNNDQGANVQFTCQLLNFVKDNNGNTVGANVNDPNALGTVIQVSLPGGTDLSQLNAGDTLVVQGRIRAFLVDKMPLAQPFRKWVLRLSI